jgi:predicted nucleotide-binding protein (sugar kinase/HSP70/actin superfamily)
MLFEEAILKLSGRKHESKNKGGINLAVVGRSYIINDDYISAQLIKKLNKRDVKVFTSGMLSEEEIKEELKVFEKTPHWALSNRVLGAALLYAKRKNIKGIIYVTPFGCSPDSLMKENMISRIGNSKPILTITVDEHTGDAGLITRIEAFIDMIERKEKLQSPKLRHGFFNVDELISKKKRRERL